MPKKILLADDSITIQKVVELTFSDGDYEVTAVNNGAKAIQKLSEMRPDIILSDIIMPEKNGYEVCEYVKSHPEYRNIPVILLTGTFEPFDPDRADKAGCDAVVTKPFESQSLIQKVEELIQQSQQRAAPSRSRSRPRCSPTRRRSSPPPAADPFTHDNDIFGAAPAAAPSFATDMPFDAPGEPAFGGETRAFPRMSFEEMQQMANEPAAHRAAAGHAGAGARTGDVAVGRDAGSVRRRDARISADEFRRDGADGVGVAAVVRSAAGIHEPPPRRAGAVAVGRAGSRTTRRTRAIPEDEFRRDAADGRGRAAGRAAAVRDARRARRA